MLEVAYPLLKSTGEIKNPDIPVFVVVSDLATLNLFNEISYATGNYVLKRSAESQIKKFWYGWVARYGGDEFATCIDRLPEGGIYASMLRSRYRSKSQHRKVTQVGDIFYKLLIKALSESLRPRKALAVANSSRLDPAPSTSRLYLIPISPTLSLFFVKLFS